MWTCDRRLRLDCDVLLTLLLAVASLEPVVLVVDDRCGGVDGIAADVVEHVVARVGADAVVASGARVIAVTFGDDDDGGGVIANVVLDIDGERAGARRLGPFVDCEAAIAAAVLTTALVIDPLGPLPASPPSALVVISAPESLTRGASRRERSRVTPLVIGGGAGVGVGGGLAPGVGAVVLGRLRFDLGFAPIVIAVGGRLDLPDVFVLDGRHRLESMAVGFFADGCFRQQFTNDVVADFCVVAEAGALRSEARGFERPVPVTAQVMALGAAVQVRAALWSGLGLFARGLVDTPLVGARLLDAGGDMLWESPRLGGLFVVGIDGLGVAGGSG